MENGHGQMSEERGRICLYLVNGVGSITKALSGCFGERLSIWMVLLE